MTQSVRVTVLGGVVPADLVEQRNALHHRPIELVNEPAAGKELLQLPLEERPLLSRSLAACVRVRSPLQPVVDHRSKLLVLRHDANLLALDD